MRSAGSGSGDRRAGTTPVHRFARTPWAEQAPTYAEADPSVIGGALERARRRPSGNWYVIAASRDVGRDRPVGRTIAGRELVVWRDRDGRAAVGPGACPHLGADLSCARIDRGDLVCHWHGLRLDTSGVPGWSPMPCHDDGVLLWARLDIVGGEQPTVAPPGSARPGHAGRLDAVATVVGVCEPEDIVANRLDPWHGAWLHPYSFARLRVVETPDPDRDDRFLVEVVFRLAGRWGVPVVAEFVCPGPRTVVMRILSGEGVGSVVETHATPLGPGPDGLARTAVVEAVIASSDRPGFARAHRVAPAVRPLMRRVATRLWRDDIAYAQRRYRLRTAPGYRGSATPAASSDPVSRGLRPTA
ncbi:phenylpropionate dioxygenase-like ring-hydroxylating dioxygenase large terminal subunit [Pseudonocardia sediminis]|uniref:Phenylpropionate dioxygenase-like ring-hydroxylating dioxygenase large terminal subunit n=1 Tax=Pseudonocardia sediminis TaxID=1397368 RepID=A0A4Q7USU0_PSEST|nr:DUF5914 domain-containing protein [Pseudonocardia sediminis]RZT84947.1 phenylpropionate dioxygenase-like ring-hydroxylating dioxygenase large terminal subunit [Pseudonocardia sediminis]